MAIDEIFPNPVVKKVIFQIRYPNLFYLENKIGDLQIAIMREFPHSASLFRRRVLFADVGPGAQSEEAVGDSDDQTVAKIWQFKSDKGFTLNVLTNSMDLTSENHQTYNLEGEERLRNVLEHILGSFLGIISLPIINRVGLRYINECPVPSLQRAEFESYYNTAFPLDRFNLADADEMLVRASIRKGACNLRYIETLQQVEDGHQLVLDFDAFTTDIEPGELLTTVDGLHALIVEEFERTIQAPVFEYMRQVEEG